MGRKLPIVYNALLLTAVNLLLRLATTGFHVYLSGQIGPAGVGLLQLVLSVGSLTMTAGIAGVRTATMYLTAGALGRKKPGAVVWILSACCLYSILCGGAVGTALYLLAPRIAVDWIGNSLTADALRLLAAFLPVNCLCGVMVGYFTASGRIGTLAAVEVAEQVLSMSVTAALLLRWAGEPAKACCGVVLGSGLGSVLTLVCLMVLRVAERAPTGARIPVAGELIRTAAPLALADVLKAGISTGENMMVPKRLGLWGGEADPLAAFGRVCGMVFPVVMFPAAILFGLAELLIPELARCAAAGKKKRIGYLVKRSLKISLLYGCVMGGLIFLIADSLCDRLYGNTDGAESMSAYALLIPMLYCDAITDAMTKGLGQQKVCVRYNILTSAMDVAFLWVLLPRYGMAGYYVSFLVTHLVNFVLSLRRLLKTVGKRLPPVAPVVLAVWLAALWGASRLPGFLRAPAFLLLLGSGWMLTGVLRREDASWLRGLLRS